MRFFAALALVAALPACVSSSGVTATVAPAAGATAPATSLPSAPQAAENNSFAGLLNNVRLANGAGNVAYDALLGLAAQGHANDMVTNNFFSHTGSNGSTVGQRATAAGYVWTRIGENIAQGQQSQQEAMTGWTNSPDHHANNINPAFQDFGLAEAGTGNDRRWVLVLGAK